MLEPPDRFDYWNLQIGNHWLESFDFLHYDTHVNHETAVPEPDGTVHESRRRPRSWSPQLARDRSPYAAARFGLDDGSVPTRFRDYIEDLRRPKLDPARADRAPGWPLLTGSRLAIVKPCAIQRTRLRQGLPRLSPRAPACRRLLDRRGDPGAACQRARYSPSPARDEIEKDDHTIPGPDGAPDVAVRVYRREDSSDGPRAGLLEIHGGGFMFGTLDMMDGWCQMIADRVDCVVVSVDYRLAPEDPYPAGLLDCHAALRWMHDEAEALGIDRERIAIAGQSAGGGLAAGLALYARDRTHEEGGPSICYQLLEIPEIDDRLHTPSMLAFQDTPFWNRPNAVWSWQHYLGPDHAGEPPLYAAPARPTAKDLSGLPPAYVSTMEFDPLRDEG